jgi:hypothetical protein
LTEFKTPAPASWIPVPLGGLYVEVNAEFLFWLLPSEDNIADDSAKLPV